MSFVVEIVLLLRDALFALRDLALRRKHHRWEHSIAIKASPATVWRMLRSSDITFDGVFPMRVVTTPAPGRPFVEDTKIIIADKTLTLMVRIAEERPQRALLMEILPDGTSPELVSGTNDYIGFVMDEHAGGTVLFLTREMDPLRWTAAITGPFGLRSGARRYQKKAEEMAAGGPEAEAAGAGQDEPTADGNSHPSSMTANAADGAGISAAACAAAIKAPEVASSFGLTPKSIAFSLAALASFAYLWGLEQALVLAAIIILHELGHAIAMLIVGMKVKGIYLVPFFGGAAIAAGPYRSEGQLGFVSLMGPGFSIIPTAGLLVAAKQTGNPLLTHAAEMSAIINLLNLVPIVPFDGGHVLRAALVSMSRTAAQIAGFAGAAAGLSIAWMIRDPIIGLFVAVGLLMTIQLKKESARTPMRALAAFGLLMAFVVTIATYVVLIYLVYNRPMPL